MAPLLEDPRFRQTWNQLSQNAEEATESAAAGIWTFQHRYITPCFASIGACFESCAAPCFPDHDERVRRLRDRSRTRGRAELSFDFYDDWDEEEGRGGGGILGWGNDELDRLLAGSGSHRHAGEGSSQPKRKRGMSYGTRTGRRKSLEPDPTVIPSTNTLGFLGRLPFKFGGTLRYKPSAADLQEHPGQLRPEHTEEEGEPLISEDESEEERDWTKGHRRNRSSTASSGETSDSFRSRGDLFPSDGEDDAVPLDDEFAVVLERRMTGDDRSSGNRKGKRPSGSRTISRTMSRTTHSSTTRPRLDGQRSVSATSLQIKSDPITPDMVQTPSLADLQHEEERIRLEEDQEIERKRHAAAKLAAERGLSVEPEEPVEEAKYQPEQILEENVPDPMESEHSGTSEVAEVSTETPQRDDPPSSSTPIPPRSPSLPSPRFVAARLPNLR